MVLSTGILDKELWTYVLLIEINYEHSHEVNPSMKKTETKFNK